MNMEQNSEAIIKLSSCASYLTSVGLFAGKMLDFLNTNAAACGVLLGFLTFLVNLYFQSANHKAIKARVNNEDL